jgi:hypothetical protein
MQLRSDTKMRDRQVLDIVEQCKKSIRDRQNRYERRRRWFLFGNDTETSVRYNRLAAHTDLVASFLFSPDSVRFTLTPTGGPRPGDDEIMDALGDYVKMQAENSGLLLEFSDALLWALIYDSMFLKIGWSDVRNQAIARAVDPYSFGVYDETESKIEDQEAFVHTFTLPRRDAILRLYRAGKGSEIKNLSMRPEGKNDTFPPIYRSLLISMTGGANISGPIVGQVQAEYSSPTDYRGEAPPDRVPFTELWIWDNGQKSPDYRQILIAGEDIVVEDSKDNIEAAKARAPKARYATETNLFLAGETPFVQITPYRMYDYFWGECPLDTRAITLQDWTNVRLEQISDILERQVDPARVFSGINGIAPDKALAFGGPHSWVFDQNPNFKVDELRPPPVEDLFREFDKIGELFMEAYGLTQTITGQGQPGVRSQGHAKQLAMTGSGRIKKAAFGLEPPLAKMGELILKLIQHNDTTELRTKAGMPFVPAQIVGDIDVSVAGHSHSPLFLDDHKELAEVLMKFSAIDRESFLKMMNPPNVESLVNRLVAIEKKEAEAARAGVDLPGNTKGEQEQKRSHHKKGEEK